MSGKSEDLYGMVPDKSSVALILLAVANDLTASPKQFASRNEPPQSS